MKNNVLNLTYFIIGWLWCVMWGAKGYPFLAIIGTITLIALQLYFNKSALNYTKDLILMGFITLSGIIPEMILMQTKLITYENHWLFPPLFIICLYPLFSLICNHSLEQILKNKLLSFILGALIAPVSYFAIYWFGSLNFNYPIYLTWILIGTLCGTYLCIISYLKNVIDEAAAKTWKDKADNDELKFFYDGHCPICIREVSILKEAKPNELKFIDITSQDDFSKNRGTLEYETAMTAMHAMDNQGNRFIALDAFAKAYARSHFYILATLLNIPFLRPILDPMYRLFAKHRLFLTGRKKNK